MDLTLSRIDGAWLLFMPCEQIVGLSDLDLEPNGYFWEGVAQYLAPHLTEQLDFDSEGGMFSVEGDRIVLAELESLMAPFTIDPEALVSLAREGLEAGFEFDC